MEYMKSETPSAKSQGYMMDEGVRCQVSGKGGAKYFWDAVVVLVLDPFGNGLHKLYFSITRTRTRNNLLGISGICHSCLCTQTAPQEPLSPSEVSEKA